MKIVCNDGHHPFREFVWSDDADPNFLSINALKVVMYNWKENALISRGD